MTREDANYYLKSSGFSDEQIDTIAKAYTEPCEDSISRQAVLNIVDSYSESQSNVEDVTQDIISDIVVLPSVNSTKTGHWIWELEDWNKWICSECGWSKRTDVHVRLGYDFCPSCGSYNGGNKE